MTRHGSTIVREVISSTSNGADVMSALPGLVRQLLDEKAWCEFTVPGLTKPVHHEKFTSFVAAMPPKGLGGRAAQLVALCGADEELRERVDLLLKEEVPPAADRGGDRRSANFQNSTTVLKPKRDTANHAVSRLKKTDPVLAKKVVSGEMSAYAASRAKGWRPPRIEIRNPGQVARKLREHMKPDQLATLVRLLTEET